MTQSVPARNRKKAFAHKVKSGCDACKRRHLKCPEEKPICSRCQKSRVECKYNPPKTRLFEIGDKEDANERVPMPSYLHKRPNDDGFTAFYPNPVSAFGNHIEKRALEYWLTETGPWLARYVPDSHGALWQRIVPRCAHLLPASRHLLITIAIVDERNHRLEPPGLMSRAKTAVQNYNQAIKVLTSRTVAPLDLFLSPILAWIIEIMVNNPSTAIMHLSAARKMLVSAGPRPHNSTESQDIVFDFLQDAQRFCAGFTSTSASCAGVLSQDPTSIFQILNIRQGLRPDTTSEEVRQAIYKYATSLDERGHTTFPVEEALQYLRHWETAALVRRFTKLEAPDTIVATHFLIATATTLLAGHDGRESDPFYHQKQAFDYLLMKFDDCLKRAANSRNQNINKPHKQLNEEDRQGLEDAVAFGLFLTVKFSTSLEQRKTAMILIARASPSERTGLSWERMIRDASESINGSVIARTASPTPVDFTRAAVISPGVGGR